MLKKIVSAFGVVGLGVASVSAGYFDADFAGISDVDNLSGNEFVIGNSRANNATGLNNILKSLKYLRDNPGGKFVDGTTATDAVFTGGNVGIGVESPTRKLEVDGAIASDAFLLGNAKDMAVDIGKWMIISQKIGASDAGIIFKPRNDDFSAKLDGGPVLTLMHTNERVGIGTTSPEAKLHVSGDMKMDLVTAGACDAANLGKIQFVQDATSQVADFRGCVYSDTTGDGNADTYQWASMTGVVN